MASPTDVTTAAAADDPDTGLRAIRALRDLAEHLCEGDGLPGGPLTKATR